MGGDIRGHEPARAVRGMLRAGERERHAGGSAVKREEVLLRQRPRAEASMGALWRLGVPPALIDRTS